MEGFVRLNKTLDDRGLLLPTTEVDKYLESVVAKENNTDWYLSLYSFGNEAKEHFDQAGGSIKGYNGAAYTNNLVFDIDNKDDLDKARKDTSALLNKLATKLGLGKEGIKNHVRVYFSGNKGFHVFVKTQRQYSSEELKEYCSIIANDIESCDKVIYNKTRAFRIANTLHQKSGLYKIPVSLDLIKDKQGITKIKELAKTPQTIIDTTVPLVDTTLIDDYVQFHKQHVKKKSVIVTSEDMKEINGVRGLNNIDFKKGRGIPKCIYALSQGIMIPGKGQRHEIFLHLGNYYRNQGHAFEVVEAILNGIAVLNGKIYPEKEAFTSDEIKYSVMKMVFGDDNKNNPGGWGINKDNKVFATYCELLPCDTKCPIHGKGSKKSVIKIEDVSNDFSTFAANFEENVIPTGIKFIDDTVKITKGTTTLIVGASGCHRKGEQVLMFDGSIKKVEDVVVGDQLMGPDSEPRNVLSLCRGLDTMYQVTPGKGRPFYVNGNHILSHLNSHRNWQHLSINKLLEVAHNPNNLEGRVLVKAKINFPRQEVLIDPYILGVWLGDGHSGASRVTSIDTEVIQSLEEYSKTIGIGFKKHTPVNRTPNYSLPGNDGIFCKMLRKLKVFNNKHIPNCYKINDRETRLQILAGLLDTDGSLSNNCFDFIQKKKHISEDVCFLAQSLGLAAYMTECQKSCQTGAVGTYYRVSISGDTHLIPTRIKRKQATPRQQIKDVLRVGFTLTKVSDEEEHYGFTLDKDNLYLLDDFTITHNTGKTTLCLAALEKTNKVGTKSMFFSADMHRSLVYMKLAQRFTNYSQDDIFRIYKTRDMKKIQEIKEIIKINYNNTYFDFSSSLSIEDIIQRVDSTEQEHGEKINLVVIDYASRLIGNLSDSNANEKINALKSKEAADITDSAWMILNQVSRTSGNGSTPLRTKRVALGSGEWESSASNVITVWRSFMGLDGVTYEGTTFNDKYINAAVVKNRMGVESEQVLFWNGRTGTIRDMTLEEKDYYEMEEKPKIKLAAKYRYEDGR